MASRIDDKNPIEDNHGRTGRCTCEVSHEYDTTLDDGEAPQDIDDCEWVDDAVSSIRSAFDLCQTHDYIDRQIEYEQVLQRCQRGREMARKSNLDVAYRHIRSLISFPPSSDDDNSGDGDEHLRQINSMASLMDDVFLDELGMEVQLQALYSH